MLSAIQPTNDPTLGTYLGALVNWVKLQSEYDCLFFAVDLHSITADKPDPKELRELTYRSIASYLAAGISPDDATLFVQSHVPQHAELAWVLTCFAYMGELGRMTQFKDKSQKLGESISAGLFAYPVLMAADILLYGAHLVPVGDDQKQHVELTRDIALRFNNRYAEDLFVVPEPFIPPVGARIMSFQNPTAKMSKSDPDPNGPVFLTDSDDVIRKKIKRAVTDSGSEVTLSEDKPGIANLLTIQSAITGTPVAKLVETYRGKQYGHLKVDTAEIVVQAIGPVRDRATKLLADRSYLDDILRKGADKASARAQATLSRVYDRVGFLNRFS